MAAGAVWCTSYAVTAVKRFADVCRKSGEGIIRGVVCSKNKKSVRKREEIIASLIKVKLRRS
jgi:hypothetical protein